VCIRIRGPGLRTGLPAIAAPGWPPPRLSVKRARRKGWRGPRRGPAEAASHEARSPRRCPPASGSSNAKTKSHSHPMRARSCDPRWVDFIGIAPRLRSVPRNRPARLAPSCARRAPSRRAGAAPAVVHCRCDCLHFGSHLAPLAGQNRSLLEGFIRTKIALGDLAASDAPPADHAAAGFCRQASLRAGRPTGKRRREGEPPKRPRVGPALPRCNTGAGSDDGPREARKGAL
jgi:hypothetical protein